MFEDFAETRPRGGSGKRFGASLVASVVVFSVLGGAALAVSATVGTAVYREELRQVAFAPPPSREEVKAAPPPEPEPPPPPPSKRAKTDRRRVERDELAAPDAIPDARPDEAEGELVASSASGPLDGFVDGGRRREEPVAVAPPPPPPPPPRRPEPVYITEHVVPPVPASSNATPAYPDAARRSGVQGVVVAKIVVLEDGRVGLVEILRGPEVFHETVRDALSGWRFTPARLDGRPIAVFRIVRVPFTLDNVGSG